MNQYNKLLHDFSFFDNIRSDNHLNPRNIQFHIYHMVEEMMNPFSFKQKVGIQEEEKGNKVKEVNRNWRRYGMKDSWWYRKAWKGELVDLHLLCSWVSTIVVYPGNMEKMARESLLMNLHNDFFFLIGFSHFVLHSFTLLIKKNCSLTRKLTSRLLDEGKTLCITRPVVVMTNDDDDSFNFQWLNQSSIWHTSRGFRHFHL